MLVSHSPRLGNSFIHISFYVGDRRIFRPSPRGTILRIRLVGESVFLVISASCKMNKGTPNRNTASFKRSSAKRDGNRQCSRCVCNLLSSIWQFKTGFLQKGIKVYNTNFKFRKKFQQWEMGSNFAHEEQRNHFSLLVNGLHRRRKVTREKLTRSSSLVALIFYFSRSINLQIRP